MASPPEPVRSLQELVAEAAQQVYDPRAKRCWLWLHAWSMWQSEGGGRWQRRRCCDCGREQVAQVMPTCAHVWCQTQRGNVTGDRGVVIGFYELQRCTFCGDVRRQDLLP